MKKIVFIFLFSNIVGCSSIPKEYLLSPTEITADSTYGYTIDNPIKVGGFIHERGPRNEREYLSHLLSEYGEAPSIQRRGSCCPFTTSFGLGRTGLLDIFELIFQSKKDTVVLYINMYDYEKPKLPKGFKIKSTKL